MRDRGPMGFVNPFMDCDSDGKCSSKSEEPEFDNEADR